MSAVCGLDNCGRPSLDGTICWHHTWQLERDLQEVPILLVDLDATLARQTANGPLTEKVQGKGETALSYNQRASEALTGLRDSLIGWARDYGMPWAEYATTSAAHLLAVLAANRTRGDLPKLCDEITDAIRRARSAVDAPANRTIIPVGPCPEHTEEGGYCTGNVNAFIPADDRPGRMACDTGDGGHVWSAIHWRSIGRRIIDREAESKQQTA